MMVALFHGIVETAINQYLALDPYISQSLTKFDNKVIQLELKQPDIRLFLLFQAHKILLMGNYSGEADTIIEANTLDLMRITHMSPLEKQQAIFQGKLKIRGNTALGQAFENLFAELEIDWEEQLSHFTGDVIAHQLMETLKTARLGQQQLQDKILHDLAEFLQYETRDLPEPREHQNFVCAVDQIRCDVERAEARIERLEKCLSHSSTPKRSLKS